MTTFVTNVLPQVLQKSFPTRKLTDGNYSFEFKMELY